MEASRCGAMCSYLADNCNFKADVLYRLKNGLQAWKAGNFPLCKEGDADWDAAARRCWKGGASAPAAVGSSQKAVPAVASAPSGSRSTSGPPQLWQIVGGADKGGVLVKTKEDLTSPPVEQRLATGAKVQELELVGERLHFRRLVGEGPEEGWISISLAGRPLADRISDVFGGGSSAGSGAASAAPKPLRWEAGKWLCPACDEPNRADRDRCNDCGKARPPGEAPSAATASLPAGAQAAKTAKPPPPVEFAINIIIDRSMDFSDKVTVQGGTTCLKLKQKLSADDPTGLINADEIALGVGNPPRPVRDAVVLRPERHGELELCAPDSEPWASDSEDEPVAVSSPAVAASIPVAAPAAAPAPPPGAAPRRPPSEPWECPACDAPNRADRDRCYDCGKARPTGVGQAPPDVAAPTTKEVVVQSDGKWVCPECDEVNKSDRERCNECGKARFGSAAVQPETETAGKWRCSECGETNRMDRSRCNDCGKARPGFHPVSGLRAPPEPEADGLVEEADIADGPGLVVDDKRESKKHINAPQGNVCFDDEDDASTNTGGDDAPEKPAESSKPKPTEDEEDLPPLPPLKPGVLDVGSTVDIKGLKSRADLNGRRALVMSKDAESGRFEVKCEHNEERIRVRPENVTVVVLRESAKKALGDKAFKEGRQDQAIEFYKDALKTEARGDKELSATIHSNMAAAYAKKGDHESALKVAQAAIAEKPGWAKAYSRMGLASSAWAAMPRRSRAT